MMATADYQEFMELWRDGCPIGHDKRSFIRLRFEKVIAPAWDLKSRAEEAIRVKCALLGESRILEAFLSLPFVVNFDQCVENDPFRTIQGLDALLALLTPKFSKLSPTAASDGATNPHGALVDPSLGREARARPKKEPHPDPESVFQANPMGLVKKRTAEMLAVCPRRVEQLLQDGHLVARGKGNSKRITCESIRDWINAEKK